MARSTLRPFLKLPRTTVGRGHDGCPPRVETAVLSGEMGGSPWDGRIPQPVKLVETNIERSKCKTHQRWFLGRYVYMPHTSRTPKSSNFSFFFSPCFAAAFGPVDCLPRTPLQEKVPVLQGRDAGGREFSWVFRPRSGHSRLAWGGQSLKALGGEFRWDSHRSN